MDILAEISKTNAIKIQATPVFCAGVWRIAIWSNQQSTLSFIKHDNDIQENKIDIADLIINNINYTADTLANVISSNGGLGRFYLDSDAGILYVHCIDHYPLYCYKLSEPAFGMIFGFTTAEKTIRLGNTIYNSGLDQFPDISDSGDNMEYGKMKFKSGNATLINTDGEYDNILDYLGNTFSIKTLSNNVLNTLYSYYIQSASIKLDLASLSLADKRQRLSYKVPNELFTQEEYPKGEQIPSALNGNKGYNKGKLWGKVKQDVYGYCVNVPAMCIDAADIYESDGVTKKAFRTFRLSRKITTINSVMVKMTGDVWVEQLTHTTWNTADLKNSGCITILRDYCMPDWTGYDVPNIYDVMVTGTFNPQTTVLNIVKELFLHYANMDYNNTFFDTADMNSELNTTTMNKPVGIMYDKQIELFAAVEKLQNGGSRGFQFTVKGDLFTARRDDNGRAPWRSSTIESIEITNLDAVEILMDTENYATNINVGYAYDYYNEQYLIAQNTEFRNTILSVYHIEKSYPDKDKCLPTLLTTEANAVEKAAYIANFFSKPRMQINGVIFWGEEWLSLRLYDIFTIDLQADATEQNWLSRRIDPRKHHGAQTTGYGNGQRVAIALRKQNIIRRKFGGIIKVKVMSRKANLKQMTMTVDLLYIG